MYGNVNHKKHPDGGYYRDYFYYACKHRTFVNGHKCTYRKQWNEDKINAAVEEVIRKLVNNPKFKTEIQKHIGNSIDTEELDREHTGLQERLKQVTGAKNKLANLMDNLSVSDKYYDKKYEDMQVRLDKLYDEIEEIETSIEAVETRGFCRHLIWPPLAQIGSFARLSACPWCFFLRSCAKCPVPCGQALRRCLPLCR